MSRAKELLFRSSSVGDTYVKLRADNENGRLHEYIDGATGKTIGFKFSYPDGRVEFKEVTWDPEWE